MNQPGPVENPHSRTANWFAWLAVIGLIVGLTAFYESFTGLGTNMVQTASEDGRAMVVLERGRSGHYLADGEINGRPVVYLIDTGATDVAMGEKTARAMGVEFGPRIRVMTAAGPARAWATRLDRVSLGGLHLNNVRATITPGLGDEVLLGMSFLKHFSLRQEDDKLIIASNKTDGD